MSEAEFRAKRRQKFLTEKYLQLNGALCEALIAENLKIEQYGLTPADLAYSGVFGSSFKNQLKLLRLHYTGGDSIESLHPLYAEAMMWFGEWHKAEHEYSVQLAKKTGKDLRLDITPVEFADLFHFQLALDVVSLGVLLGEADQVREVARLMASSRHSDMMFEAIIERYVPDPSQTEEFFHEVPYGPLLDAIYTASTPAEASAFVKTYLDGWYKAFEGVPWHDGHLVQTAEYSNYEGYWAFEAAAVCVIHGIDDTSFRDHIVYPKDLADWAREHRVMDRLRPGGGPAVTGGGGLRCDANRPCPREGFWFTPAKSGSRRLFKQGEVMPEFQSGYGLTIWQWDENQAP